MLSVRLLLAMLSLLSCSFLSSSAISGSRLSSATTTFSEESSSAGTISERNEKSFRNPFEILLSGINDTEIKSSSAATAKITSSRAGTDITIVLYRLSSNSAGYEQKEVKVTLVTAKELGINTSSNQDKGAQDNQTPSGEDYHDDNRDDSYNYNPFEDFFNW